MDELNLTMLSKFQRMSHILYHRKGNTHGQGKVLRFLLENGSLSQKALQNLTRIRAASLSEAVAKLLQDGYVTREVNISDKRSIILTITESGKQRAIEGMAKRKEMATSLFSPLTNEEKAQFSEMLNKLLDHWEATVDTDTDNE